MRNLTELTSISGMALGMVIGVAMGIVLFQNAALGLIFGVAIGSEMESGARKKKKRKPKRGEDFHD